jgi:ABC-2 type transport system ATP-binding protein
MIYVESIKKYFKRSIKGAGLKGSFAALFNPKTEIVKAVDDVSFHVGKGEMLGLIGPNGAGKSTLIKMLTGVLTPTEGSCRIGGFLPQKERARYVKEIGVVFGQRTQLWWDLPLRETFTVLKEIYEVEDNRFEKRMDLLRKTLELDEFSKSPVRTLSLGQRMRADIAASLLHSPKVVFLDEPTIGLDVVVKENIRNAVREMNKEEGTTFVLTTHDISDIEQLCERIVMIDKGKKVFDGGLGALRAQYGQARQITVEMEDSDELGKLDFTRRFGAGGGEVEVGAQGLKAEIKFNSQKISISDMLNYVLETVGVKDISVKDADIEEIIRRLYKEGANV